jgi:hypothetical protein
MSQYCVVTIDLIDQDELNLPVQPCGRPHAGHWTSSFQNTKGHIEQVRFSRVCVETSWRSYYRAESLQKGTIRDDRPVHAAKPVVLTNVSHNLPATTTCPPPPLARHFL